MLTVSLTFMADHGRATLSGFSCKTRITSECKCGVAQLHFCPLLSNDCRFSSGSHVPTPLSRSSLWNFFFTLKRFSRISLSASAMNRCLSGCGAFTDNRVNLAAALSTIHHFVPEPLHICDASEVC